MVNATGRRIMTQAAIHLRPAGRDDLEAINQVIAMAIDAWDLPDRVKRLALPSYRYSAHDLDHLEIILAETMDRQSPVGLAALEPASSSHLPADQSGLLLHGIYVAPDQQNRGIGRRLIERALRTVADKGLDGLLVKAQPDAAPFFKKLDMQALDTTDPQRDYPYRFWKTARDSQA